MFLVNMVTKKIMIKKLRLIKYKLELLNMKSIEKILNSLESNIKVLNLSKKKIYLVWYIIIISFFSFHQIYQIKYKYYNLNFSKFCMI